jgi:hypothetical protein
MYVLRVTSWAAVLRAQSQWNGFNGDYVFAALRVAICDILAFAVTKCCAVPLTRRIGKRQHFIRGKHLAIGNSLTICLPAHMLIRVSQDRCVLFSGGRKQSLAKQV